MIKCPKCGKQVEAEYDTWNNLYWACYHCGLISHQIITYSNDTVATIYL